MDKEFHLTLCNGCNYLPIEMVDDISRNIMATFVKSCTMAAWFEETAGQIKITLL